MARLIGWLAHLGHIAFDPEEGGAGPVTPGGYVAEDGVTAYVAEDGTTFYVQEH